MVKINETFAKKIEPPTAAQKIHYDEDQVGFGLRITKAGSKAFILNYHMN